MSSASFKGYAVHDKNNWSKFDLIEFQPKTWEETDVDISITHCGVCGSDLHTITGGWGDFEPPLIPGHEVVGIVTRVGSQVQDKGIKVGERVGCGAQIASCYTCKRCKTGNENYCKSKIPTYGGTYPDGINSQGGYSTMIRANERYVFPIPSNIESKYAASMLCAGLTVWSPLTRHNVRPGTTVGIVGIGGLGHYAVMFAKALGARVVAFSHDIEKKEDVLKMGADAFIHSVEGFKDKVEDEFDMILTTTDVAPTLPLADFLSLLKVHGQMITVGIPDDKFPQTKAFDFAASGAVFGASHIGSKKECMEMLKFASEKGIKPWVEVLPMKDAKKAVESVHNNTARYRIILEQDISNVNPSAN